MNPLQTKIFITPEPVMILKLALLTEPDKRNKRTSKSFDDDVISSNCGVIAFFG